MQKIKFFIFQILVCFVFTSKLSATTDLLVYRSEYEKTGDIIFDLNDPNEGKILYTIVSGNINQYYQLGITDGVISIKNPIADVVNQVKRDTLTISASGSTYRIMIVDGFDYLLQKYNKTHKVLNNDGDIYIDNSGKWTAYNNLWGSGTAVVNTDFRSAILYKTQLPDSAIILWDTPSKAEAFAGASVWSYINLFYGNRYNMRENLPLFPFQINTLNSLTLDFNFEKLFGTEDFKIAMNMFLTNESYLTKATYNDGDFFFIFDQVGTFVPEYPYQLPDTIIDGNSFALRYDNLNNGEFYERRRVVILNNQKYMSGKLDINNMFKYFSSKGYLNLNQYIYHIQLGIEVTQGFGAILMNKATFDSKFKSTENTTPTDKNKTHINQYQKNKLLFIETNEPVLSLKLFNTSGINMLSGCVVKTISTYEVQIDNSSLPTGIYIICINNQNFKIFVNH